MELLELSENWKYRFCSWCSAILCMSLQKQQCTFLNNLTGTTLDIYSLLSFPVHYGLSIFNLSPTQKTCLLPMVLKLTCLGWSLVFESSNIQARVYKTLQWGSPSSSTQILLSRLRNFGEVDLRRPIDKVLAFQMLS